MSVLVLYYMEIPIEQVKKHIFEQLKGKVEPNMLDENIIEDIVLREYSRDEDNRKSKKKHFFSIRHRRRHRRYMRDLYRRYKDGQSTGSSRKIKRFCRTGSKFAKAAVAACIAVFTLAAVHVTATNVHLGKIGNSLLQGFDDHIQFSDKGDRPKILKWLNEKLAAGKDNTEKDAVAETEFEKKVPQYLPEGYELISEDDHIDYGYFTQEYDDSKEHYLYYRQYTTINDADFSSGEQIPQSVQINGLDGFLTADKITRTLVWTDGTYYYCLNGNVDDETLLEIAVNVN